MEQTSPIMADDPIVVDVNTLPELTRLAKEVAEDGRSRVLRADGIDLAVISPVREPRPDADHDPHAGGYDILAEMERRRKLGMNYAEMTAGILKPYAKNPPPTP